MAALPYLFSSNPSDRPRAITLHTPSLLAVLVTDDYLN